MSRPVDYSLVIESLLLYSPQSLNSICGYIFILIQMCIGSLSQLVLLMTCQGITQQPRKQFIIPPFFRFESNICTLVSVCVCVCPLLALQINLIIQAAKQHLYLGGWSETLTGSQTYFALHFPMIYSFVFWVKVFSVCVCVCQNYFVVHSTINELDYIDNFSCGKGFECVCVCGWAVAVCDHGAGSWQTVMRAYCSVNYHCSKHWVTLISCCHENIPMFYVSLSAQTSSRISVSIGNTGIADSLWIITSPLTIAVDGQFSYSSYIRPISPPHLPDVSFVSFFSSQILHSFRRNTASSVTPSAQWDQLCLQLALHSLLWFYVLLSNHLMCKLVKS